MSTKSNKILEEIHPLSIIQEVEKWPVLYSKDSRERGSLHFKNKVWHEVGKALFSDWNSYSDAQKECKVTDLSKRWRNLRDTFKRQVELEKRVREGFETKRKTYVFYKHMLFLLPHVSQEHEEAEVEPKYLTENRKITKKMEKRHTQKRKLPVEQHFVTETPVSTKFIEDIDEDKHFLMSLIPTFKRMNDDEKLTAKMEILKVLREIRKPSTSEMNPMVDSLSYEEPETSRPVKIEFSLLKDNNVSSNSDSDDSENG